VRIVDHYEDFYASHNHMPGSGREMKVTGTVVCRTGGCSAELRDHEGNAGINPQMLALDLVLTGPDDGTAVTDVLTPIPVEWRVSDPAIEYREVQFFVVGTEDEPPPVIGVDHPE
jgi:hypothetical protein